MFVCDDSEWFCELVAAWLEGNDDIELAGSADTRESSIAGLAEANPDVVLLDTMTYGLTPLTVAEVYRVAPGARVVICSGYPRLHAEAVVGKADGYLNKDLGQATLLEMLRAFRH